MGRASQAQARRNRQRVVEAAAALIRTRGAENTAIADVMRAAGLTPGGFYKQFASRDALIDEASALAFRQAGTAWKKTRQQHDNAPQDALEALVRRYFRHRPQAQGCPILALSSLASQLPDGAATTGTYRHGVQALLEQFRAAATAGDVPAQEHRGDDDILLLFAAMVGAGLLSRAAGDAPWVQQLQSAVLAALPADPSAPPQADRE